MNRIEEYEALLKELETTPENLESTVEKALKRENTFQKKRRILVSSAGSLAACFAAFVLLVNLSVPFARACGSIPLISDLARAVSWSPSLSAAVEHDYVRFEGRDAWLDSVTIAPCGDGVVTADISVSEMHAWAAKAKSADPALFIAGII